MSIVVGIYSSQPQSGKSTVSTLFQEEGYTKISLAEPVKWSLKVVLDALGVINSVNYLWGDRKEEVIPELGCTGGALMSVYATDFFRNVIDSRIWINCLQNTINLYSDNTLFVLDDLRFPNELDLCDITIKVIRPGIKKPHGRSKISEGQLDNHYFDYTIINDSSLSNLEITVYEIINDISRTLIVWEEKGLL